MSKLRRFRGLSLSIFRNASKESDLTLNLAPISAKTSCKTRHQSLQEKRKVNIVGHRERKVGKREIVSKQQIFPA